MSVDPGLQRPPRLLVVEDNPVDLRLLRAHLEDLGGHELAVAGTLAEALAALERAGPDLVLLDLTLPDCRGLETFHRVVRAAGLVPIVVLTGTADQALARKAVALGAQDYVVKGDVTGRAIRRVIEYSIERHRFELRRRDLEIGAAQSRRLEAIGQLAAGIAHEINTPAQFVSDNVCFLKDAFLDLLALVDDLRSAVSETGVIPRERFEAALAAADADDLLAEIPRAFDQTLEGLSRVSRIVRAMKEFSHPETPDMVPTDLNKALETTVTVAAGEWKYVADVELDLDPDLPPVDGLPGELNQVFLNLIVNAAHAIADAAGPEGAAKGRITVATRRAGADRVDVAVSDTGTGIPEAVLPRIFEPFFTTKEVGKGTGQGLALAYHVVVKKHKGELLVRSKVGEGTTFTVRLPVRQAARQAA